MEREGVALSAAAGLTALGITLLLVYETWALATNHPPITWHVRRGIKQHPQGAFAAALGIGLLLGHLFWGTESPAEQGWEDR